MFADTHYRLSDASRVLSRDRRPTCSNPNAYTTTQGIRAALWGGRKEVYRVRRYPSAKWTAKRLLLLAHNKSLPTNIDPSETLDPHPSTSAPRYAPGGQIRWRNRFSPATELLPTRANCRKTDERTQKSTRGEETPTVDGRRYFASSSAVQWTRSSPLSDKSIINDFISTTVKPERLLPITAAFTSRRWHYMLCITLPHESRWWMGKVYKGKKWNGWKTVATYIAAYLARPESNANGVVIEWNSRGSNSSVFLTLYDAEGRKSGSYTFIASFLGIEKKCISMRWKMAFHCWALFFQQTFPAMIQSWLLISSKNYQVPIQKEEARRSTHFVKSIYLIHVQLTKK